MGALESRLRGISRRSFLKTAGATAGLALGFPAVLRAQAPEIPIGILHPVSGPLAPIGRRMRMGAQLAIEGINNRGGIESLGGAKLTLLPGDTESNAAIGRAEAARLIRAGAVLLTGAFQNAVSLAIAQVAEQRSTPFVIDIADDDTITQRGYKHVFRIFPTEDRLTTNAVTYMREIFKTSGSAPKSVVVLHTDDLFGSFRAKAFSKKCTELKAPWEISEVISYPAAAEDLAREVGKVKELKPDVVAPISRLRDAILLVGELFTQRLELMGIVSPGAPGFYEQAFIAQLGALAEFIMDSAPWPNPSNPLAQQLGAEIEARHHKFLDANSGYAFEAIMVAADALERASSTKDDALLAALRDTHIPQRVMAGGPIEFAPNGDNVNASSLMIQNLEARPRIIWPKDLAEAEFKFPAPQLWERG